MAKSKGHKHLNKFQGWARYDGLVSSEMNEALEEFFVNPTLIPEDRRTQAMALFHDWFLMDRKTTRRKLTPIEIFLETSARKLKKDELAVYLRFSKEKRFGIFKVEAVKPGESMDLKLMPAGPSYHVTEEMGSTQAEPGSYIIGSIVPFEDHWVLFVLAAAFPNEDSYRFDRSFETTGKDLKGELRQRHVLKLFMPKVKWEEEGLQRVRARLSMLLQRWGGGDITAAQVEKDILAAHERQEFTHPLQQVVLGKAPSIDDAKEAVEVLTALWNLTLPKTNVPRGPKEMMLIQEMQDVIGKEIAKTNFKDEKEGLDWSRVRVREWLATPQKELDGRSPRDVIKDERLALGNPQEEIGYAFLTGEPLSQVDEGARLANKAQTCLASGDGQAALELLEKAYKLMKGHDEAFRILGNMATAHVLLGHREEAVEMLRAAIKANPDYEVARDNMHLLENMSPEEFRKKHEAGFFKKMNIVRKA